MTQRNSEHGMSFTAQDSNGSQHQDHKHTGPDLKKAQDDVLRQIHFCHTFWFSTEVANNGGLCFNKCLRHAICKQTKRPTFAIMEEFGHSRSSHILYLSWLTLLVV